MSGSSFPRDTLLRRRVYVATWYPEEDMIGLVRVLERFVPPVCSYDASWDREPGLD